MDSITYNNLLEKYDEDVSARIALCRYWLGNIKRRLIFKYGDLIDVEDVAHDILLYIIKHRPKNMVFAPFRFTIKCIDNYIASHLEIFDRTLDLPYGASYEQTFLNLEKTELMQILEKNLDKVVASIVYRCYVDGEKEKDVAKELNISYTNLRAMISRAKKKLKKYYSDCNKN